MKYLIVLALLVPTLANAQLRTADGGAAVVDNHGLMWADAVGISLFWGLSGEPTAQDWVAKLNEIDYGGYNDWMLPTGNLNVAPNTTSNQLGELFYTDCGNTVGAVTSFKHTGKNCIDVAHLRVEIETFLNHRGEQHPSHVGVGEQQRLEVLLLGKRAHGVALHPFIGLLARHAPARQLQQDRT